MQALTKKRHTEDMVEAHFRGPTSSINKLRRTAITLKVVDLSEKSMKDKEFYTEMER